MPILTTEDGLSMGFIRNYLGQPGGSVSLRSMSAAVGNSTPDAISEFVGSQISRFTHISGAFNIGTQTGDLYPITGDYENWKTFDDQTLGDGNTGDAIFSWDNVANFGATTMQVFFRQTGGATIDAVKIFQSTTSSGPWTERATAAPPNVNALLAPSNGLYLMFRIQKEDGNDNTLYTVNLKIGCLPEYDPD